MSYSQNKKMAARSSGAGKVQRQQQLPFRKAVDMAWMNIRHRLGRSLLVTSGIILSIAFLTHILCSDKVSRAVPHKASPQLLESLQKSGALTAGDDADARVQTRWMVGLALLVSFVGILNAMLLSVTERFSEIGTMKCLGALDSLIVKLFLLESFFQGVVGTVAGVLIGLIFMVVEGLQTYGTELFRLIPYGDIAASAGLCTLAGIGLTVAGALYPAWRAAKMQPVVAMRTEV